MSALRGFGFGRLAALAGVGEIERPFAADEITDGGAVGSALVHRQGGGPDARGFGHRIGAVIGAGTGRDGVEVFLDHGVVAAVEVGDKLDVGDGFRRISLGRETDG